MTVQDLIDSLEGMDPEAEVRFASQPNYPFEYSIYGVIETEIEGETIVYLEEGNQIGYLPKEAKEDLGW
jgi:hypothetical protein